MRPYLPSLSLSLSLPLHWSLLLNPFCWWLHFSSNLIYFNTYNWGLLLVSFLSFTFLIWCMVFVLIHLINLLWMDLAIKTCGNGLTYGPCGFFFFFNIAILYYFVVKDSKTKARKKKSIQKKKYITKRKKSTIKRKYKIKHYICLWVKSAHVM